MSLVKMNGAELWQKRHFKKRKSGKCTFKLFQKELYGMRRLSNSPFPETLPLLR